MALHPDDYLSMTTTSQTTSQSTYVPRRPGLFGCGTQLAEDVDDAVAQLVGERELLSLSVASIAAGGPDADLPATTGVLVTAVIRDRT